MLNYITNSQCPTILERRMSEQPVLQQVSLSAHFKWGEEFKQTGAVAGQEKMGILTKRNRELTQRDWKHAF